MKKATAVKKTSKSKPKSSTTKSQTTPKNQSKSIPKKSTNPSSQSKEKVKEESKKPEVKEKQESKKEKTPNTKSVKLPDEKRDEYKVIRTIKAHDDWVQKLLILKNGKVTCIQDSTLKLWDFVTEDIKTKKTPIFIYKGHTDAVTDVIQYTNEKLVSISRDKTIKQWNINSGKEITSYNANMPFSCIIQISDTQVALGSGDKIIKFYDLSPMDNNFGDEK